MHRQKKLTRLNGGGDQYTCLQAAATRTDFHVVTRGAAEILGVRRINLEIDRLRVKFLENGRFAGAGLRVPLRGSATPGQQKKRELLIRHFGRGTGCAKDES